MGRYTGPVLEKQDVWDLVSLKLIKNLLKEKNVHQFPDNMVLN